MNKPINLGISKLDISKTLMYKSCYDYIKPKYHGEEKLCYMDTDSFLIYIKTEDFYKGIANDVKKSFDTSNYSKDDNRLLPSGWNEKIFSLLKHELGGRIMKEFTGLRVKTYPYLMDDDSECKKALKEQKKNVIKRGLMFKNYIGCSFNDKIILKPQQRFKSDSNNVYTQ